MFGLGSVQNQVSLPLTHIASAFTNVRGRVPATSRQPRIYKKQIADAISSTSTCAESLNEAAENFTELQSFSLTAFVNNDPHVICPYTYLAHVRKNSSRDALWKTCHISTDTFFENVNGFPRDILYRSYSSIPLDNHLLAPCKSFLLANSIRLDQRRYFRTRHSNTSGLGRSIYNDANRSFMQRLFGFRLVRDGKEKQKLFAEAERSDKLKALLSDTNLTKDEQQKIKVNALSLETKLKIAFAEGYLSSDGKSRPGTKLRIFNIFRDLMGIVLIIAILFTFMGGSFRVQIGGSNEVHPEEINVTFGDVKGVDEAKQELLEIVEFLKNPEKFSVLGGKLPKGVLLVGPPGTGKTLLARAVAGEAGVPFFHAAGPEFDEILVGQGARRVRDLFSTAKSRAPCVVFIDEIDSVGAKRTNSVLHPYANQTINQLLSEMDGFRQNEGVIVLGATNRREDLDKALLRPGRFDVEVQVPPPDLQGRKEILQLYLSKVKTGPDVDVEVLARGTTGFTGADIENLVNQAAVRAAIDEATMVSMKYLENSRDKVLMGPERRSRIPDDEANTITAYHEGGHALVAYYTKDAQPLHKVTIVPRGPSLGHTAYIPEKERYHVTKSQMMATLDTLMGGRAAEELIFGPDKITSGASSDLKQATALAINMVKEWGMSEKVGVRTFEDNPNSLVVVNEIGVSTTESIDSEIKRLLTDSYERARQILKIHSREHKMLAEALLKYETLDADDIKAILGKKDKERRDLPSLNPLNSLKN